MWHTAKDANQRTYYYNDNGETSWEKPEPLWTPLDRALRAQNWIEFTTEQGRPYWYNSETKQSVWDVPVTLPASSESALGSLNTAGTDATGYTGTGSTGSDAADPAANSKQFGEMLERLNVGSDYLLELPRLVKEPSFWKLPTAVERQARFDEFLAAKSAKARSIAHAEQQARIDTLCQKLAAAGTAAETWESAKTVLDPLDGSIKEKAFAFVKSRSDHQARLKDRQDALHKQLAPRLAELLGGVTLSSASGPEWTAVRMAVENQLPLDPDTDRGRLVQVYDEFSEAKFNGLMAQLDDQAARSDQKTRRARNKFVQVLEQLRTDGSITASTRWQDIVGKIPPRVLERLCGTEGSSPLDLFWDVVSDERRKLRIQTGLVEDALTVKNIDMSQLDETQFVQLFKDDRRLQASKLNAIYAFLSEDRHLNHRPRAELEY